MERRDQEFVPFAVALVVICFGAAATFFFAAAYLGFHTDRTLTDLTVAGPALAATAMAVGGLLSPAIALVSVVMLIRGRRRSVRLEARLARMSQTAEQAGDLFAIVNRRGRIEYVNPAVEKITGYTRQELIGKRSMPWLPWYESERLFDDVRSIVLDGGSFGGTVACRRKDGAPFVIQEQVTALCDESGRVARFVSTASDVTREKRLEDRLKFLRANDPVTGLPNRRTFSAELSERLQGGRRLDVIVLDIDRFKLVNDVFGPALGDEVLRRVGKVIRSTVAGRDVVARLGSDEFGVIHEVEGRIPDVDAVAERIRKAVSGTISIGGQDVIATVSIGIASRPEHGNDAAALLRHAGMALAQARSQGRNGVLVFSPELSQRISGAYSLERNLAGALRNGEYEVDYQPYCDLTSRELTGAEALLRWRSPELGTVSPALFVPALEESGAIVEVGEWVLRAACHQVGEWRKRDHAVAVAVNLSHIQFRSGDLVPMVSDALQESGIDPGLLTLELTESVCISDIELTIDVLKRLKEVGVSLSVDDFGTGYSSLSYIQKLPVDTLKIDQSFVREVARDPDAASIVSAITGMARSLRLRTIAEGVESEEQRNVLRLLRCDYGQGYLFSPAVPAGDFERFCSIPDARPASSAPPSPP